MLDAFSPNTLFGLDEWWTLCRVCRRQHKMQKVHCGSLFVIWSSKAMFRAIPCSSNLIISAPLHLINLTLTRTRKVAGTGLFYVWSY